MTKSRGFQKETERAQMETKGAQKPKTYVPKCEISEQYCESVRRAIQEETRRASHHLNQSQRWMTELKKEANSVPINPKLINGLVNMTNAEREYAGIALSQIADNNELLVKINLFNAKGMYQSS